MTHTIQITHDDYLSVCDFYDDTAIVPMLLKRNLDKSAEVLWDFEEDLSDHLRVKTWLHFPNFWEAPRHPKYELFHLMPPWCWTWVGFTDKLSLRDLDKMKKIVLESIKRVSLTQSEYEYLKSSWSILSK